MKKTTLLIALSILTLSYACSKPTSPGVNGDIETPEITLPEGIVAYFPMDISNGNILDLATKVQTTIQGNYVTPRVGNLGGATRFDGRSNYATAVIDNKKLNNLAQFGVSIWLAIQTYPADVDGNDNTNEYKGMIVGNIDHINKMGLAVTLSTFGDLGFDYYSTTGALKSYVCNENALEINEWSKIDVSISGSTLSIYVNGEVVKQANNIPLINVQGPNFTFAKYSVEPNTYNPNAGAFCGLIDDVKIFARALTPAEVAYTKATTYPDFFSGDAAGYDEHIMWPTLRPTVYGRLQEVHGFIEYNNMYHAFCLRPQGGLLDATNQCWGHIVSEDLVRWEEVGHAIAPSESYDRKGCWSGTAITNPKIANGAPQIIYTAVGAGSAQIVYAEPDDLSDPKLNKWNKPKDNMLIEKKPTNIGLKSDFRDPDTFEHDGKLYMVIGASSSRGNGCALLYQYDEAAAKWNYKKIFYEGLANVTGAMWEKPNVIKIKDVNNNGIDDADDLYLFIEVQVPGGTMADEYPAPHWIGTINDDGTFKPIAGYDQNNFGQTDLPCITKGRTGLKMPTFLGQTFDNGDYRVLSFGVVPAHCVSTDYDWSQVFSIMREWSLDENNKLVQKPFRGLTNLRTETSFITKNKRVSGDLSMLPVRGRQVEVEVIFDATTISNEESVGVELLKSGDKSLKVTYTKSTNTLTLDVSSVDRILNGTAKRDSVISGVLPETAFDELKLHIYYDNSIMDIFINDKWAASKRYYPTNADPASNDVSCFVDGGEAVVTSCQAWVLK